MLYPLEFNGAGVPEGPQKRTSKIESDDDKVSDSAVTPFWANHWWCPRLKKEPQLLTICILYTVYWLYNSHQILTLTFQELVIKYSNPKIAHEFPAIFELDFKFQLLGGSTTIASIGFYHWSTSAYERPTGRQWATPACGDRSCAGRSGAELFGELWRVESCQPRHTLWETNGLIWKLTR